MPQYILLNLILKFGPILNLFIYFLNLFHFFDFFGYFKSELQVHEIMQCSILKNIIHGVWCMLSPYLGTRIKFFGLWPSAKHASPVVVDVNMVSHILTPPPSRRY